MGKNASTRTVLSVENINKGCPLYQGFFSGMGFRDLTVFGMGDIKRKDAKEKVERRY